MSNSFPSVIEKLKENANVRVVVDANPSMYMNVMSVSRLKLTTILNTYAPLYELVNKCWSNLPNPPHDDRMYVFMWVMACENYSVNHSTIKWEGATPNTFVHLWSIMDRMKHSLERLNLSWVVGPRNCADYCRRMGMTGPLDSLMYVPELVVPVEITKMEEDFIPISFESESRSFCSFYEFNKSVKVDDHGVALTVSDMEAAEFAPQIRTYPRA